MKVVFLATPEVHLLDLSGPAHIFYEAAEHQPDIELHYIHAGDAAEIKTSSGLHFSKLEHYKIFQLIR